MRKHTPLCVELLEIRNLMSCVMPPLPTAAVQQMIGDQNAVMALVPLTNVTDEAIGGNWSDPHSWKSGVLPGAGANIEIDPGITEVYDLASSPAYNTIRVDGTLSISGLSSTSLLVQTIVNMPTGTFNDLQSNVAISSTITFADTGPLDIANDPKELGRGYLAVGIMNPDNTMGAMATTNIVGAQKTGWVPIFGVVKGTSQIDFGASMPTGWQVGDKILFNGTGPDSQDETVAITGISGTVISFAPLQYDHLTPSSHAGIAAPTPPSSPNNLTASTTDGQAVLTWDASAGATSYNVYRSTTSGAETLYKTVTANTLTDTGLADGTTYYYWVTGVNSLGEGGRTGELQAMPQAGGGPIAYHINFTGDPKEIPAGYIDDGGLTFRAQNGATYGWAVDNTPNMRDREASNAPDEVHDSFGHMQRNSGPVSQWTGVGDQWSIAVPNGTYTVHILGGDPSYTDSTYNITANGQTVVSGTPTSDHPWLDGTVQVTVTNGLITIGNGTGSVNDKIDSIDITGGSGSGSPTVTHAGPPPAPPAPPPPPSGGVQMQTTVANLSRNIVFQSQVITPAAPTLIGTVVSSSELDFSWNVVADANGYQLQRNSASGWHPIADITDPTITAFQLTGLSSGAGGDFRVLAVHDNNTSAGSNVVHLVCSDYPIVTNGTWPPIMFTETARVASYISPLRLGHIMFMHTDQDTIDYVQINNMGRTDKSKPLGATSVDTNGEVVTNVIGRYALHFHRLYNFSADCLVSVVGDVVTGGPGWGFDNHSSNVSFQDDIDYGTFGAGFVTEAGDETGSFIHDLAVHNESNHSLLNFNQTGIPDSDTKQDYAKNGFNFWIQGKYGIALENNVGVEATLASFWIGNTGLVQGGGFGTQTTKFWTQNITDPTLIPSGNPVGVDQSVLPELDFKGNTSIYSNEGEWISGAPGNGSHDHTDNFTAWNVIQIAIENYYEIGGHIDGAVLLGLPHSTGIITTDGYSSGTEHSNEDIEGFLHGLEISGRGANVINDAGYFDNLVNLYIGVAGGADPSGQITIQGTDPQFGQMSHQAGGSDYHFIPLGSGDWGNDVDQMDNSRFRFYKAFMNTTSHPNQQIYMDTANWNTSPFILADPPPYGRDIPTTFTAFGLAGFSDADKAMTNGQLWQTYGRTVGGYAAPQDAVPLPNSNVLIAEMQPTLPSWQLESPREVTSPLNYIPKLYDRTTKTDYTGAAVNLHEGWNFIPETVPGEPLFSLMVFVDTQPPVLGIQAKQVLSVSLAQLSQPFTVYWTYQDNSLQSLTPTTTHTDYSNLLAFPLQTRSDGTQFLVIPIKYKDSAGNVTELDVTINVTLV